MRAFQSTGDLLRVVSDRIAKAFNRSGDTGAVAVYIFKSFDRAWHADLLPKRNSYGILGQVFDLVSFFIQ